MSDIQDTLWKMFKLTGKVSYYELYRAVKNEEQHKH